MKEKIRQAKDRLNEQEDLSARDVTYDERINELHVGNRALSGIKEVAAEYGYHSFTFSISLRHNRSPSVRLDLNDNIQQAETGEPPSKDEVSNIVSELEKMTKWNITNPDFSAGHGSVDVE